MGHNLEYKEEGLKMQVAGRRGKRKNSRERASRESQGRLRMQGA